jgi:mono/diheme cytochrome c family protein
MTTHAQRNLRLRKLLFLLLLAAISISVVFAIYQSRQWKIPEEAKLRKNPIQSSPAALAAARAIYFDKCVQCHGETGKGDGPDAAMYYPSPASLIDAKHMSGVTDGELFYEISQGRKPMPSFKKRLTEEQRWQLVLFVRSLSASTSGADAISRPQ